MSKRILADGFLPSQNSAQREAARERLAASGATEGPDDSQAREGMQARTEKQHKLRTMRQMVPLHSGFGFGAEAIKAKSQNVARSAQQRKNQRLAELLNEPLGSGPDGFVSSANSAHSTHLANVRNEQVVQAGQGNLGESLGGYEQGSLAGLSPAQDAGFGSTRGNVAGNSVGNIPANSLHNSAGTEGMPGDRGVGQPRPVPYSPARPEPISRAEAFCAWAVDFLFAACVTFISSLAGRAYYLLKGETLFALLVRKFRLKFEFLQNLAAEYQALIAVLALALLFIWIVQTISALFTRSTLGGFVVGVTAAKKHSRLASGVVFGTLELASLGGLLKLPFVLITPQVTPLASWMKLERTR